MERLREKYTKEVVPVLMSEFSIKNKMAVPRLVKVVINMGIGDIFRNKELLESARKDLSLITGQVPEVRKAKKSVASFGVRRGMPVGLRVTLRGERMYAFLDKLFCVVLPRLRDFRGLSLDSFDKAGNYTIGFEDDSVFPEIDVAKSQVRGLEVSIITNTNDVEKSRRLLELLGMPFERK